VKDIELAKEILLKEDFALVAVKNGEIIFKSNEKGIKPMYELATEMKDIAKGASIADKVIGRGAALLCSYLDINEAYGRLISKAGMEILEKNQISYDFMESCEYIKNRDGTDYCPIEKLSMSTEKASDFLEELRIFFSRNKD